jgi:hypothetical protein
MCSSVSMVWEATAASWNGFKQRHGKDHCGPLSPKMVPPGSSDSMDSFSTRASRTDLLDQLNLDETRTSTEATLPPWVSYVNLDEEVTQQYGCAPSRQSSGDSTNKSGMKRVTRVLDFNKLCDLDYLEESMMCCLICNLDSVEDAPSRLRRSKRSYDFCEHLG